MSELNYGSGGFFDQAQGIFSGVNDMLGEGLNTWIRFEEAKSIAESGGRAQHFARTTAQQPSGTAQQPNPAAEKASALPNLTTQQMVLIGGALVLAYFLTK